MLEETMPVKFNKLKTIFHISDIHIRNVRRHIEYREVFEKIYNEIKKDTENAIIMITGDIVHAKLEMSPELVDLTFEFFKNLSDILPTFIITGNHDTNLANPHRMDVISPIVKNIDNPDLFYLKHSGVYTIADVKFVVMSVFEDPSKYIKANQVTGETKIALYHGTVQNALSETGFKLRNNKVTTKMFDGYDAVLLGDIHRAQSLQTYNVEEKNIATKYIQEYKNLDWDVVADLDGGQHRIQKKYPQINYPGSCLQQNFGEDLEHGILKWDVTNKKPTFIHIPNDYAHITLNIEDGKMPNLNILYPKSRIRLLIKNTPPSRITEIVSLIREKCPNAQDINEIKLPDATVITGGSHVNKTSVGNTRDINFQNILIETFIKARYTLHPDVFTKILEINKELNSQLKPIEFLQNIIWKPKMFEFSNMFSYGEGNKVDFEKFSGIVGLFAQNRSGKSNFLESLCFTIFDKSPRALKSESAMNSKRDTFNSTFAYSIGEETFRIKRSAKRNTPTEVTVKTDFSVLGTSGSRRILNGERRSSTNLAIRNYVGDYETFVMTAFVPQIDLHKGTSANLINMRQADRKNLLNKFLDLTIFQELYDLAKYQMKIVEIKLSELNKYNFSTDLASANIRIKTLTKTYDEKNDKKRECETLHKQINTEIKKLTKKLVKIDVTSTNLKKLIGDKNTYEHDITNAMSIIEKYTAEITLVEDMIAQLQIELSNIDENVVDKYATNQELVRQKNELQHNVDKYQIKINIKREQLGELAKFKFNPSCNECTENKILIDSKVENNDTINETENILTASIQQVNAFDEMLRDKHLIDEQYTEFLSLHSRLNEQNNVLSDKKHIKVVKERELDDLQRNLIDTNINIETYYKNEKTIELNNVTQESIDLWEDKLSIVENGISEITRELMGVFSELTTNKQKKQKIEDSIEEIKNLEIKLSAYKYYTEATEKDGIPFDLIVKIMPIIEQEVNNILAQMVDFQIHFKIDEVGKDIEPKIVYDSDNVWAIELTSGMERFISSVAIRVALLSVSSLPRPNFLVIDEGWGVMDSENANNLYRLFGYLREQFEFILIISHLDYIKDMSDTIIELQNVDGFSKIVAE